MEVVARGTVGPAKGGAEGADVAGADTGGVGLPALAVIGMGSGGGFGAPAGGAVGAATTG
jgi:hypothetical protein